MKRFVLAAFFAVPIVGVMILDLTLYRNLTRHEYSRVESAADSAR